MAKTFAWVPLTVVATALASCAEKPLPPTLTTFDGRSCAASFDLANAMPVLLDGDKEAKTTIDHQTPCFTEGGVQYVYAVFHLPETSEEYLLSVTSAPLGHAIFSPRLRLLDNAGKVQREVGRDAFSFHNASLYVGLRAHPAERYLLIVSDPAFVGQDFSQIVGMTRANMATAGPVFFEVHTGSESNNNYSYALNGSLTVVAQPVPKVK